MRKVVHYTFMSLDGAVDDPDRFFAQIQERADAPEFDAAMEANEEEIIATQGAVLFVARALDADAGPPGSARLNGTRHSMVRRGTRQADPERPRTDPCGTSEPGCTPQLVGR
jgi:hypothetical protein